MKTTANIFLKIIFIIAFLGEIIIAPMAQDETQAMPEPAKKEIPRITFKNISPPFTDYDYFQGYQEYPFQVQATAFSLINAWWLAEASTLVYADEDFVRARFNNAESLHQRLMLIDEARYSLDIQYYLWYGDNSGELAFKRVMDAARRGVRVHLIVDDVLLASEDETIAVIDAHPNVEGRLFNPWISMSWVSDRWRASLWDETLKSFVQRLHPGTSKVVYDTLEEDAISQKMATIIPAFSNTAKNELLIVNAYVIPNEDVRTRQPAQSFWQRVMDVFFKLFPSKYF